MSYPACAATSRRDVVGSDEHHGGTARLGPLEVSPSASWSPVCPDPTTSTAPVGQRRRTARVARMQFQDPTGEALREGGHAGSVIAPDRHHDLPGRELSAAGGG